MMTIVSAIGMIFSITHSFPFEIGVLYARDRSIRRSKLVLMEKGKGHLRCKASGEKPRRNKFRYNIRLRLKRCPLLFEHERLIGTVTDNPYVMAD